MFEFEKEIRAMDPFRSSGRFSERKFQGAPLFLVCLFFFLRFLLRDSNEERESLRAILPTDASSCSSATGVLAPRSPSLSTDTPQRRFQRIRAGFLAFRSSPLIRTHSVGSVILNSPQRAIFEAEDFIFWFDLLKIWVKLNTINSLF